jgi:hypothetical protein
MFRCRVQAAQSQSREKSASKHQTPPAGTQRKRPQVHCAFIFMLRAGELYRKHQSVKEDGQVGGSLSERTQLKQCDPPLANIRHRTPPTSLVKKHLIHPALKSSSLNRDVLQL